MNFEWDEDQNKSNIAKQAHAAGRSKTAPLMRGVMCLRLSMPYR